MQKHIEENLARIKAQIENHEKYREPVPEVGVKRWNQRGNTGPF